MIYLLIIETQKEYSSKYLFIKIFTQNSKFFFFILLLQRYLLDDQENRILDEMNIFRSFKFYLNSPKKKA